MQRTLQVFNFSIQNAANDAVDIHIDGDIVDASTQAMFEAWFGDDTSVSFKSFRNQVNNTPAKTYNIYINSGGGLVTDAMAMHDFIIDLQNQGKTVNTIGRGIVASAATYILMASKNAEMSKNSWFMVHNVSGGIWGDVNTIERYAATLRQFNDRSRDFYSEYTKIGKEDVAKLMNNETWMTADEAKDKGFIKSVSGDATFTNHISKDHWHFTNQSVLNAYNSNVKTPPAQAEQDKNFFQNQFDEMKNWIKNALGIKDTNLPENADQKAILNAVVDGLIPHLETLDTEIEAEVTNRVDAAVKGEAFTNAVNAAVTAQMVEINQKVAAMEQDIVNKLGQPHATGVPNNATANPIPQGQFSNE